MENDSLYKYFINTIRRILERGGKYRKNDILDALILQHLYTGESNKIITYDKDMIAHLLEFSGDENSYEDSFSLIQECSLES